MLEDVSIVFPNMRINRFFLPKGSEVVLHAHPEQYGCMYILQGSCLINKYEIIERINSEYRIKFLDKKYFAANDYCVLTPKQNIHALILLEDTIILDVFAPGKSEGMISEFLKITIELEQNEYKAEVMDADEVNKILADMLQPFTKIKIE